MSLEESGVLVECAGELREEISDVVAEGAGSLHGAQRVGVRRDAAESGGAFCDGFAMLLQDDARIGSWKQLEEWFRRKPPYS